MKEPERFLEGGTDDFTKELLGSAFADEPSGRAFQSTAAALGLAGAMTAASSATSAAVIAAGSQAAGAASVGASVAAAGPKLTSLALVKWLGIGAIAGLVTAGGGGAVLEHLNSPPLAKHAASVPAQSQGETQPTSGARPGLQPGLVESKLSDTPAATPTPLEPGTKKNAPVVRGVPASLHPESTAGAAKPPLGETSLSQEIKKLDRAKKALATGSSSEALNALDEYSRTKKTDVLGPEATVLRIEALRQQGQTTQARALARDFVATHPNSPHASRLRALGNGQK